MKRAASSSLTDIIIIISVSETTPSSGPTSAGVLLTDPVVLTGVALAGRRPAAAPVNPEHPPPPRAVPLRRPGVRSDRRPVELQAVQAAGEVPLRGGGPRRGGGEEQCAVAAQHPARLGQRRGGGVAAVQGQAQGAGVDLQQDVVPPAVRQPIGADQQRAGGGAATAEPEEQLAVGQLGREAKGQR